MKKRTTILLVVTLLMVGVVGCDGATKQIARSALRGQAAVALVAGVLDLMYVENRGAAFNPERLLPTSLRRPLVILARLIAIPIVIVIWARRRRAGLPEHAAYALMVAGAIGNFGEQILRGHVTDFIHVHGWPVFNVADISLVAGMALLSLLSIRSPGEKREHGR